jgi:hypothetical protein
VSQRSTTAPPGKGVSLENVILDGCDLRVLPQERQRQLLDWALELLELRVGEEIFRRFGTGQVEEFEAILATAGDEAAFEWLLETVPDCADIVAGETERLRLEISARRHLLIAAAAIPR